MAPFDDQVVSVSEALVWKSLQCSQVSGCIRLPSQRTLRDYTHCVSAATGFLSAVDQQLMRAADVDKCPERQKYVALILDEMYMYVKEDLVYNRHSGAFIGFRNLGNINEHLLQFQASLEDDSSDTNEQLAKTMLVLIVGGLLSGLVQEFPYMYVQLPCTMMTGDLPLWKAIACIKRCGLKVLAMTADGASASHCLFKIHNPSSSDTSHNIKNPYSTNGRDLFFLSDPPHLLKTTRNCFASKSRMLWVSSHITSFSSLGSQPWLLLSLYTVQGERGQLESHCSPTLPQQW